MSRTRVFVTLVSAAFAMSVPVLAVCNDPPKEPMVGLVRAAKLSRTAKPVAPVPQTEIDTSPLVVEGIVNTTTGELWKVFSTAEGFKAFGVAQCELDLRVGGQIRSHYDPKGVLGDEGTIHNVILAYEPERMMAFRISKPPKNFPFPEAVWSATWSVATLTDLGDGRTHLRLSGMGYTADAESQKMRGFFKAGNAYSMKRLQGAFDKAAPAPTGPVHADGPLDPIVSTALVNAPATEVYRTLTTSAGWKAFLGVESTIEAIPGGRFEISFDSSAPAGSRGSEGCVVQSVLPDRMLSFSWNAPPTYAFARGKRTSVVVVLEPASSARTKVTLTHLGYVELAKAHPDHSAEFEQVRAYFAKAWPRVLSALEAHVAQRAAPAGAGSASEITPSGKSAG